MRNSLVWLRWLGLADLAICLLACRGRSEPTPAPSEPSASTGASVVATAEASPLAARPSGPPGTGGRPRTVFTKPILVAGHADGVVMEALRSVSAACKIDLGTVTISGCANGEDQRLTSVMGEKSPMSALETLSIALVDEDARLAAVASNVLYYRCTSSFRVPAERANGDAGSRDAGPDLHPSTLTRDVARRLLWGVSRLPGPIARFAAPSAVHAGMIKGEEDNVFAMLEGHPDDGVREEGYPRVLAFGRLRALPKLRELAKAGGPEARFALDAVSDFPNPSEPERTEVCGWARTFLASDDANVATAAARGMLRCRGPFVDALLDEAARREKAIRAPLVMVVRDICRDPHDGSGAPGTPAQCERTLTYLEAVARDTAVDSYTRGQALYAIAYAQPDKKSLALMRQFQTDTDVEVRGRAKDAIVELSKKSASR